MQRLAHLSYFLPQDHVDTFKCFVIGEINRLFARIGVEWMPQVILDDIGALQQIGKALAEL